MVAAVIGSRSFQDYEYLKAYLEQFPMSHIVSGGACGADSLAERYAKERNIMYTCISPDYKRYGRGAPIVRNKEIIGMAECCIAFWDGESKGTKHALGLAEKAGVPVKVVAY